MGDLAGKCVHQVFRLKPISIKIGSIEGCSGCEYDPENNKYCGSGYSPLKMIVIEVKEKTKS